MVNIAEEGLKPTEFEESVTINASNIPKGKLTIQSTDIVEIKKGVSQGQKKLVVKLKDNTDVLYSYFPNKITTACIGELYGDETNDWVGQDIKLKTTDTFVNGQQMKMVILDN